MIPLSYELIETDTDAFKRFQGTHTLYYNNKVFWFNVIITCKKSVYLYKGYHGYIIIRK